MYGLRSLQINIIIRINCLLFIIQQTKQFMLKAEMRKSQNSFGSKRQDYSLLNCSKVNIRSYDHYDYQRDIKKIKYPTYSISNAEDLEAKIQSFRDQNVRAQLRKQIVNLNSYRKVRGDGNCFFRALAFGCLAQSKQPTLKSCFGYIDEVCLTCCFSDSIPSDFKKFYEHQFLYRMLSRQWEPLYSKFLNQSGNNARKALIKVFDEYPFLDFIVILYFRALCLKGLWKMEQKLKQFLLGNEQQSIRTYSEQTEGVSINICSILLKVVINVFEVRKGIVKVYHYDDIENKKNQINLLFFDNHYDIIEHNEQIDAQKNSLSKSNYYSDLNRKMVKGRCVQCDRDKNVYEDSSICFSCFDLVQRMAKRYDNSGKLKYGRCQDCYRYKEDILEDIGICKLCIQRQNQEQERRKKRQQKLKQTKSEISTVDYQTKDEKKGTQNSEEVKKSVIIRGKCIQCGYIQKLDSQTNICQYCRRRQQREMNRLKNDQERNNITEKIMKNTGQKITNMNSPNKRATKITNEDINYSRFKLKQNESNPSEIYGIGSEIKPKPKPEGTNDRGREGGVENRNGILAAQKNMPSKSGMKNCEKCKSLDYLTQNSPLCSKCYTDTFKSYQFCIKCKCRLYVHEDTKKCAQCHYNTREGSVRKAPNTRQHTAPKNKCMKCSSNCVFKEGLCSSCHSKHYCTYCHRVTFMSLVINGKCSNCRNRAIFY